MFKKYLCTLLLCAAACCALHAQPPARRIDTTMKFGKAGYRVTCNNKNPDKNQVSVKPVNFEKEANDFAFEVKGRVPRAEVDDVNRDGFPDLLVYCTAADSTNKTTVVCIVSEANQGVAPVMLPDIYDDPKLRPGYKGNDSFFLMEGNLIRRFPLYPMDGAPPGASAGNMWRQVMYSVVRDERGGYKFKAGRSYDFVK